MTLRIPPGGFAGFAQMTPASRLALRETMNGSTTRRSNRRKSVRKAKRATTRRKAKRAAKGRKLKFGSPAWRKKYLKRK